MSIFDLDAACPLPDHWTPLEAVAVVKCLDEQGELGLFLASTQGVSTWEVIGMLTAALDTNREDMGALFIPEDEE